MLLPGNLTLGSGIIYPFHLKLLLIYNTFMKFCKYFFKRYLSYYSFLAQYPFWVVEQIRANAQGKPLKKVKA